MKLAPPSHEAAEHANLPPVHAKQRAALQPCVLQPALLSHREELAAHEIAADRRVGAPLADKGAADVGELCVLAVHA